MALNFQQKLQALMDKHKVEKSPQFLQNVATNLFEQYLVPAATKCAPSVNIEWDVLMSMVGGNHGDADAVVQYLEKKEGLKITNAVPSGNVICIRWKNVRPPLKY